MHLKCSLYKYNVVNAMKRTPAVLDVMTPAWEVATEYKTMLSFQRIFLLVFNQIFPVYPLVYNFKTLPLVALKRQISRAIYKDVQNVMRFC